MALAQSLGSCSAPQMVMPPSRLVLFAYPSGAVVPTGGYRITPVGEEALRLVGPALMASPAPVPA